MPTTKPRLTITETDEVAQALDEAARQWPDDAAARSRLVLRLVEEGYQALLASNRKRAASRRIAVRRTSGALTGAYEADYLASLRDEWPT